MRGVTGTRRLAMFQGAEGMTMSGQRLMRGMGVVLANLVVPGRFAMKPRRLLVVFGGGGVVNRWVVRIIHDYPLSAHRLRSALYSLSGLWFRVGNYSERRGLVRRMG